MKVNVKTVKDPKPKEWAIEPKDTVRQVKEKLQAEWPEFEADLIRLVCAGKVLKDEDCVESLNLPEGATLVVMTTKKQPAPAAAATTPAQASTNATASSSSDTTVPVTTDSTATAQQGGSSGGGGGAASDFTSGPELEGVITNICDMGFSREQVQQALAAAYNNPDRAVEYLMNGMPVQTGGESGIAQPMAGGGSEGGPVGVPSQPTLPGDNGMAQTPGISGAGGQVDPSDPLAVLRNYPQFQQIRNLVQQDPSVLQQIMGAIARDNPTLFQLINQHPEEFVRLLQEPGGAPGAPGGGGGGGGGGQGGGQRVVIQLTPEEDAQIRNLEGLGFARELVIEAYLACDKNEELAANYLFENMNDFAEDDQQGAPDGGGAPGGGATGGGDAPMS